MHFEVERVDLNPLFGGAHPEALWGQDAPSFVLKSFWCFGTPPQAAALHQE